MEARHRVGSSSRRGLPWSSIPPILLMLSCRPPHPDCCSPGSPGCPWRPCSISRVPPISAVLPMLGLPPTPPAPRLPPISLMPPSFSVLTGQPCRPSYLRASMRPCYPCSTVHAEKLRRNFVGLFMLTSAQGVRNRLGRSGICVVGHAAHAPSAALIGLVAAFMAAHTSAWL